MALDVCTQPVETVHLAEARKEVERFHQFAKGMLKLEQSETLKEGSKDAFGIVWCDDRKLCALFARVDELGT